MLDVESYLDRIRYTGPREASVDTLRRLHVAHLLAVPFENLDIHLSRPIVLYEAALYRKIIEQRRGGFCYELNGVFATLLRSLGFRVTLLSAGVARAQGGFGPEYDHLALRVDLEEPWLADVGFGEGFREPLRLTPAIEQDGYRLDRDGERWVLRRSKKDAWEPQYTFTMQPRQLSEYGERSLYHQTSPESSFTRGRLCTIATHSGRMTVTGPAAGCEGRWLLIETEGTTRSERTLAGEEEFAAVLRERFGVTLGV